MNSFSDEQIKGGYHTCTDLSKVTNKPLKEGMNKITRDVIRNRYIRTRNVSEITFLLGEENVCMTDGCNHPDGPPTTAQTDIQTTAQTAVQSTISDPHTELVSPQYSTLPDSGVVCYSRYSVPIIALMNVLVMH